MNIPGDADSVCLFWTSGWVVGTCCLSVRRPIYGPPPTAGDGTRSGNGTPHSRCRVPFHLMCYTARQLTPLCYLSASVIGPVPPVGAGSEKHGRGRREVLSMLGDPHGYGLGSFRWGVFGVLDWPGAHIKTSIYSTRQAAEPGDGREKPPQRARGWLVYGCLSPALGA